MSASALPPRTLRLVRLTLAICRAEFDELKSLRQSAPEGEPDRTWREAWLQAHLFAGIPRTVEAGMVLAEAGGLGQLSAEERGPERSLERGRTLFGVLYGERAQKVEAALDGLHPALHGAILGHAYGDVLTREGLDTATRELLAVAALADAGLPRQLASHARGAMHAGARAPHVLAAVEQGAERHGPALRQALIDVARRYASSTRD